MPGKFKKGKVFVKDKAGSAEMYELSGKRQSDTNEEEEKIKLNNQEKSEN